MIFFILFFIIQVSGIEASNINSIFNENLYVQPTPVVQLQFPYNINTAYVTTGITGLSTSGSGAVTQGTGMALISPGTTTGSAAVLASDARLTYRPGQGLETVFSAIFDTPVATNTQYIGVGNARDGFFFGYDGINFGILYRSSISGSLVDTWIAKSSWNNDTMDGSGASGVTLTPGVGNIYRIQYHWLGFGVVKFFIQNPTDGTWILVHYMSFLNGVIDGASPIITNASMQLLGVSSNSSIGTSNTVLKTSCMMGAVQGQTSIANNARFSVAGTQNVNIALPIIRNIISIRNSFTFPALGGLNNQVMIYPDMLSLQCRSTTTSVMYLILNGTGPTPNISVNTNSVALSSSTSVNITSGTVLLSVILDASLAYPVYINLADLGIRLAPGDMLSVGFGKAVTGGGGNNFDASLSWTEGF